MLEHVGRIKYISYLSTRIKTSGVFCGVAGVSLAAQPKNAPASHFFLLASSDVMCIFCSVDYLHVYISANKWKVTFRENIGRLLDLGSINNVTDTERPHPLSPLLLDNGFFGIES